MKITESAVVELTWTLVERPSPNPPGGEGPVVDALVEYLEASPVEWTLEREELEPGRPNLVARAGNPEHGRLLLTGHTDVVPANADDWTGDPYELRRESDGPDGDRLVGRGVADMKGALAAKVVAAEAFLTGDDDSDSSADPGEVVLGFAIDEERGGPGTERIAEAVGDVDAAVVGEPTDLHVAIAQYGALDWELVVYGRESHSGRPDRGINAIDGLRCALNGVADLAEEVAAEDHPILEPGPTITVTEIEGGSAPHVVPGEARATVSWRTLPEGPEPENYDERMRAAVESGLVDAPPVEFELRRTLTVDAAGIDADHPLVRQTVAAAGEVGVESDVVGFNAGSDTRHLIPRGIPAVLFGPGTIEDDAHTVDESVAVSDLVATARVYERLLERYLLATDD
ncbi:M20 family metallopeptidase [Haloprofundus halophilus]|uniref:M20 family metallopeptidase n=1 Tax=Haloprofundus halophilus TaxID=2283527 RepID=UPI00130037DB|nr:M20/M25/M40 family metallo-hydrolase [Haloprofundus halophilus]